VQRIESLAITDTMHRLAVKNNRIYVTASAYRAQSTWTDKLRMLKPL